ncbi:MAG: YhcB family protein [Candidatus Bathyarchaeota archaeon]|nr:YhcB family protein [Candidatus Bathyarchaeota archaeon]
MGALEEIFAFLTGGSIGGLTPIIFMIIPLIVGLIIGYLVHKFLKIAVIIAVISAIAIYFGFLNINTAAMAQLVDQYGPMVVQYGTLLIGLLPLSIGLIVGLAVGFLLAK